MTLRQKSKNVPIFLIALPASGVIGAMANVKVITIAVLELQQKPENAIALMAAMALMPAFVVRAIAVWLLSATQVHAVLLVHGLIGQSVKVNAKNWVRKLEIESGSVTDQKNLLTSNSAKKSHAKLANAPRNVTGLDGASFLNVQLLADQELNLDPESVTASVKVNQYLLKRETVKEKVKMFRNAKLKNAFLAIGLVGVSGRLGTKLV